MKFVYSYGSASVTFTISDKPAAPSSSSAEVAEQEKLFRVTFPGSKGNTVKAEWVKYGGSASAPTGYGTYSGYWNATANMDLRPADVSAASAGFIIPNTAAKN